MIDEAVKLAVPAITLGFKVSNDDLLFENSEYSIYYRYSARHVIDSDGVCRECIGLMEALQACAIDAGS